MSPRSRSTERPPRGNGRDGPSPDLPYPHNPAENTSQRDWRIRAIGLVAALFIALAALVYFFGQREFSPVVIILITLAGLAAIAQSILVLLEFRRK